MSLPLVVRQIGNKLYIESEGPDTKDPIFLELQTESDGDSPPTRRELEIAQYVADAINIHGGYSNA